MDDSECDSDDMLECILQDPNSMARAMQFEYLKRITNDFSHKLGEGGFGEVYKGGLQSGNMIAVKKIKLSENPDVSEMQFKNEVFALRTLRHPNIVRCVGYCFNTSRIIVTHNEKWIIAESPKMLLCFEYLTMGSLDKHLKDGSSGLDWRTCYKIIKGVCSGLHYLHEECIPQNNNASNIHLDLKPANILLDENMVPKLADFGLSKLFYDNKTQTCPGGGTPGYMAPEYISEGKISTKADIYSLGVVIIEIITGCKADPDIEKTINKWRNRSAEALSLADCQQIRSCLEIGKCCIKSERNERPTTGEIIKKLSLESIDCSLDSEEGHLCNYSRPFVCRNHATAQALAPCNRTRPSAMQPHTPRVMGMQPHRPTRRSPHAARLSRSPQVARRSRSMDVASSDSTSELASDSMEMTTEDGLEQESLELIWPESQEALASESQEPDEVVTAESQELVASESKMEVVPDSQMAPDSITPELQEVAPDSEMVPDSLPPGSFVCARCHLVHEDRQAWNRAHSRFWPCSRCGLIHADYIIDAMLHGLDEFDCKLFIKCYKELLPGKDHAAGKDDNCAWQEWPRLHLAKMDHKG